MNQTALTGGSLLCEALALIDGDRNNDYGDFGEEAVKLAAGFSALVGCSVSPDTVPLLLMWLKMVRQAHKHKRDNLVDLVGYAELLARMHSDGQTEFAEEEPTGKVGSFFIDDAPAPAARVPLRDSAFARKTRVYIAGPYTIGNHQENVNKAMSAAAELIKLGYWAYPPHWTHYLDIICPQDHGFWMEYDRPMVTFCDALLLLPGESKGAEDEVIQAKAEGKPVFNSVEELQKGLGKDDSPKGPSEPVPWPTAEELTYKH